MITSMRSSFAALCCAGVVGICCLSTTSQAGEDFKTIPYQGCGFISLGAECPLFIGDDGTSFSLNVLHPFQIGDYVNVSGEICLDCPSTCQQGPVFLLETISICGIDECGTLEFQGILSQPCIVFVSSSGNVYAIDNFESFNVGDTVRVSGLLGGKCPPGLICGTFDGCLNGNTIGSCGQAIAECGTIVAGGGIPFFCLNFWSDSGPVYAIENTGFFGVGSRVRVSGVTTAPCPDTCGGIDGCIMGNDIIGCPDIDESGSVDVDDLLAVIAAWGPCITFCPEDLIVNGQVDVDDLLAVIGTWGT